MPEGGNEFVGKMSFLFEQLNKQVVGSYCHLMASLSFLNLHFLCNSFFYYGCVFVSGLTLLIFAWIPGSEVRALGLSGKHLTLKRHLTRSSYQKHFFFETGSYVLKAGLELKVLLFQPPKYWDFMNTL